MYKKNNRKFHRYTVDEMIVHKVRVFYDNHYEIEEIAAEMHITVTEVNRILLIVDCTYNDSLLV